MAAIEVGINTDSWYKVERSSWVGATGWVMLAVAVGVWPFRLYPFYWFTGMQIETKADLIIVGLISFCSLITAMLMFSQPRSASAESEEGGKIVLETGFTTVQVTEIPFSEVASVSTGMHPLCPLATRVSVVTKAGKMVPFAWDLDKGSTDGVAKALNALLGGGAGPAPAAADESAAADQPSDDQTSE